jgi:AAA family ATP:ADP antiporter
MTKWKFGSGTEDYAVAAAVAAGTVMIAFQIAGKATRDALFLSTFGVAALPPMVITAAIISALVSVALARLMARSRPNRLIPRLLGLSALLLLAEWALAIQARRPAAVLLYLHFTALGALLVSGFWAIVNERFDPRTARRTIGHITAGGSFGGLLGGLLPERVGALLPLTAMLPILAGLHLLASALVVGVDRGALRRAHARAPVDTAQPGAWRILQASPYLLGLTLLVALTSAAEGVLDYVFKARASAAAGSGEELLRLFAAFYTVTALLGISIQVTTLRRVLGRLGIARSAALLPTGVSLGAIGALLIPGLIPVLLARGAEVVLRSSLFRAGYELLFTPVAPREKRATKLLIDVGAARIGDVLGGALIAVALVLTGAGTGKILLGLTVALSLGALVVARRLHLGYVAALEGSLQRRSGEVPDPWQDEGSALLQTVGAFDLSGIRQRPEFATTAVSITPGPRPSHPAPDTDLKTSPLRRAIGTGNRQEIETALATASFTPDEIEAAIELLAWDEIAPQAIRALREVARTQTAVFVRHLLDPQEDFAIRRRLVTVLAASRSPEAFNALFEAMRDRRFEVRYRSARALSYLTHEIPGLQVDRDRVFEVMQREMAVERGLWETRQLIDQPEDETSPMEAEALRGRTNRSLEHLFTLLSLALPAETVRLAFHGLHTGDRHLRGTALEYLETVLPAPIWSRLWPFLDEGEEMVRDRAKSSDQALQELLASRNSITLAVARAPRGSGSTPK